MSNPRDAGWKRIARAGVLFPLLLSLAAACGEATAPGPEPGAIRVSFWSEGGVARSVTYQVSVDDETALSVGPFEAVTFTRVAPGAHRVRVAGIPTGCAIDGGAERSVVVGAGQQVTLALTVACVGSIVVTTSTSGDEIDPDGYGIVVCRDVCASNPTPVDVNGSVTISSLERGSYRLMIVGVAANCRVTAPYPVQVSVGSGDVTEVALVIRCARPGSVQLTNATAGADPDPDGYRVHIADDGVARVVPLAAGSSATITELFPHDYTISVEGVAENCDVMGGRTRDVEVQAGGTTPVALDVSCSPVTRLAFVSDPDGTADIFVVASNGTAVVRLTSYEGWDVDPAWSPDGTRIAFASDRANRGGSYDIYVMNADGSNVARLTTGGGSKSQPAWSPDGRRLAFSGDVTDGFVTSGRTIYVMDAVPGAVPVSLTSGLNWSEDPAWSPDGGRIAFAGFRDGAEEIYVVDAAGGDAVRVPGTRAVGIDYELQPAWSPDGRRIAFVGAGPCGDDCDDDYSDDYGHGGVYVTSLDGTGPTKLSHGTRVSWDARPTWSPDGGTIAFSGPADGCQGPCVLYARVDGSAVDVITPRGTSPSWRR